MSAPTNAAALAAVTAVEPVWAGQTTLANVLSVRGSKAVGGAVEKIILHAGPPFTGWDAVPQAVRNSMAQMAVFEGWAADLAQAQEQLAAGQISYAPAQDYDCVVPLAGVITPSMGLHVVTDKHDRSRKSYAAINEGMEHLLRVGKVDAQMVPFHRWLNGAFNDFLGETLAGSDGIELFPLIRSSLADGDDAHSRTMVGSRLLVAALRGLGGPAESPETTEFLDTALALALNLWMAAAALAERAAEDYPEADLITRVGGNGVDFGYQTAAAPQQWVTVAGQAPQGPIPEEFVDVEVLGAIGDSAVVDFFGLGGGAISHAPATVDALGNFLPYQATERLGQVFLTEHPQLPICTGVSRARLAEIGVTPIVLLGMIEATGEHGRVGGGAYEPTPAAFA